MMCKKVKGLQLRSHLKCYGRLKGYFCSKTVFNVRWKVLTETEIRVLEKGLRFAPTPSRINESDLKRDFNEFSRNELMNFFEMSSQETFQRNQPLMLNLIGIHLTVTLH